MNESIRIHKSMRITFWRGICQGASNKPGQCMRTCRIPMYPLESQDVAFFELFRFVMFES